MVAQHAVELLGKFFSEVSSVCSCYGKSFLRFLWWTLDNSSNYGCELEDTNEVWVTFFIGSCLKSVNSVIVIESVVSICQGRSSLLPFSGAPWTAEWIAPQPDWSWVCICRVKYCCLALTYRTDIFFSCHPTLYAVSLSCCLEWDCRDLSEIH